MICRDELVEIGCFRKPHGVKGEIAATSVLPFDDLRQFPFLVCCIDGIYVPFFVLSLRFKGQDSVLIMFDGIDDENKAKKLSNKKIYVLKKDLPETDEVYCEYFIGYDILDANGGLVGKIIGVDDSTANVLFVVGHGEREIYVPVADDFICDIDEVNHRIVMELPDGMVSSQLN